MASGKYISYLRVRTDRQDRSGLGLDAQRAAVASYLNGGRWFLEAEYVETGSGKRADRPMLAKALARAKSIGATLIFAKLDRLSRNVDLLRALVASGADLVFLRPAECAGRCHGTVSAYANGIGRGIGGWPDQRVQPSSVGCYRHDVPHEPDGARWRMAHGEIRPSAG